MFCSWVVKERGMCQKKRPGPVSHSFFPLPFPLWRNLRTWKTALLREHLLRRWGRLSGRRVEVGTQHQDRRRGDQVALRSSSSPEGCTDLWVPWASCGSLWACLDLEIVLPSRGEGAVQVQGGLIRLHILCQSHESRLQTQACSGPRDATPARVPVAWRGLTSYFCLGLCVPICCCHFHKWIPLFPGDPVYGLFIPEFFFPVIAGVRRRGLLVISWKLFFTRKNGSSPERLADFLFLFSLFRPQWTTWRMRRPVRSATCSSTRATRSCGRTWCTISTTGTSGRWRTSISSPGRWAPAHRAPRFRSRLYPTSGRQLGVRREGLFQKQGNLNLLLSLFCLLTLYPFVLFSKSVSSPEISSITEAFQLGIDPSSWFYVFSVFMLC